jgi:hypothetical protein
MKKSGFNPVGVFACLEAIEAARKGDYTPLDARLAVCLAGHSTITVDELQFIREHGFVPVMKRSRGPRKKHPVVANQESLAVTRTFIEASKGYQRGHIKRGWSAAVDEHGMSKNTVKKHLRRAKRIWGGEWFKSQCEEVRKGGPIRY